MSLSRPVGLQMLKRWRVLATNLLTIVNVFVAIVMGMLVFSAWPKPFEWEGGLRSLIAGRISVTLACATATLALTVRRPLWLAHSLGAMGAVASALMITYVLPRDFVLMPLGAANIGMLGWIAVNRSRARVNS